MIKNNETFPCLSIQTLTSPRQDGRRQEQQDDGPHQLPDEGYPTGTYFHSELVSPS